MEDARTFGFFSIFLGGTIIVLSSFLSTMPVFLAVGMVTGTGILISGVTIVGRYLVIRDCPICGEILKERSYKCAVCGHEVSNTITPSLIRRLLH